MSTIATTHSRYTTLDGLRAYSAIGIILMHVLANSSYKTSIAVQTVISSFTDLVYLFMIISAFSLCCGYYEKLNNGSYSLSDFYQKRFSKILPFFSFLILADVIITPTPEGFIEALTNLTLCFGLLPNAKISVIGVGWFLGLIFVFYLIFPFFSSFMLKNKARAWASLAITAILNAFCQSYFFDENHVLSDFMSRSNIIFCGMFFVAGGLIYLYKDKLYCIKGALRVAVLCFCISLTVIYILFFFSSENRGFFDYFVALALFSLWLIYAIGIKSSTILSNPVTKLLSKLSMEMYLCHMLVFRVIQKLGFLYLFGKGILSYIFSSVLVIMGAILISLVFKRCYVTLLKSLKSKISKKKSAA